MQTSRLFTHSIALTLVLALAGCGRPADNPYTRLKDPPLVQGSLHAVSLVSDSPAAAEDIVRAGLTPVVLPPNYQQADAVEASIWGVPEPVAAKIRHFKSNKTGVPDVHLLVMPLAARGRGVDQSTNEAFFRNVLGSEVPAWPLDSAPSDKLRVQVWTYLIPDVLAANRRFRENGIPVIYDPVGLTTSYLGDHQTLAIRAPDGTVVQLVATRAQ